MLASSGSTARIVASEPPHCGGCRQAGQAGKGEGLKGERMEAQGFEQCAED